MAKKLSDAVKLNLRFTEELRRKLERAANKNNQSMNLEIVARLEKSFRNEEIGDVMREQFATFMQFLEARKELQLPMKEE